MECHIIIGAMEKKRPRKGARVCCAWAVKEDLGDKVILGPRPEGGQRISCELNCRLRIPRKKDKTNAKALKGEHVCLRK